MRASGLQRHASSTGAAVSSGRQRPRNSRRSSAAAPAMASASAAQAAAATAAGVSHVPTPAAREALFGVAPEQVPEVEAPVTGSLPAWLSGSLLVNGGGDYSAMTHMFDGYASLTKVRLGGGRAWGSQRFIDTKAYAGFKQQGRVVIREFATRPQVSGVWGELKELLGQLAGLATNNPTFTDNASVSLQAVAARPGGRPGELLLALSETPAASYLVDPADLSTLRQVQYSDGVPGNLTTAHPSILPDGRLLNFSRTLPFGGFHIYTQQPDTLERTEVAFVPDRKPLSPAWLHDFASTDKYAVLLEQPLYMSLASLLLGMPASHLFMNWEPQDEVKVHVVALDGSGEARSFTCPTFFFFHVGNAFESEDGTSLCVDLAAYDDPAILNDLLLEPLRRPALAPDGQLAAPLSPSAYKRLTIPLTGPAGGRLQAPQALVPCAPDFCEFPAINPGCRGQPYRYLYCLSATRPTNIGNSLSKLDLQHQAAATWHEPGGTVGEPVFVPRPGAAAEDDGVVVAPGVDGEGRGFVLVMDAGSWTELARVQLPFAVPNRFHGIWLGA